MYYLGDLDAVEVGAKNAGSEAGASRLWIAR
jgi:hypothetical protein